MPTYDAPTRDIQFILHDVLDIAASDIPGYSELDRDFTAAIVEEAGKVALMLGKSICAGKRKPLIIQRHCR